MQTNDFTKGNILPTLIKFMLPILFAMFLQAMYGAVDLLVVGRFATNADVSAVSTGSQILHTLTNITVSFAMGITVSVAQKIGEGDNDSASKSIGSGIWIYCVIAVIFTVITLLGAPILSSVMNAPTEAFDLTVGYTRICGGGFVIICAYNLLGSIFRGLGDSKTPLIAVGIACAFNVVGDLILVYVFNLGAYGAAIATVAAQLISVLISLVIIKRQTLPFRFERKHLCFHIPSVKRIFKIGTPIALQDFLVSISFLVLIAIVNEIGLNESAGVGFVEKVCAFSMLVPSAFMQSMSSFVAQNIGAGKPLRATEALRSGIAVSVIFGIIMFFVSFFKGNLLALIFSQDELVVAAAFEYLKAYGVDCLLTCFLFCFIGYYNGLGSTAFVMLQGIIGAFGIRIPVAFIMRHFAHGSLFWIGMATPSSTIVQIILFFAVFTYGQRKSNGRLLK